MIVNSLTSGFMHGGEPVAGGLLVVFDSKEHRGLVQLYLDGEIYNHNPVTLNQNGRILQPLEAKEESVYCEVLNNVGNFLFGFELRGTAALLPFVPNSLNSKSTGVTDGGSIVIKNAASLNLEANAAINMTGEAKIKMIEGSQINLGSHAKLLAMGKGAISGLQGVISSSNVLEEYARAYSLTGTISLNEEISAEAKDSFLEGDVFYFIAEENKIDVNYFGTNGEPQKDTLNKGEALSLILAGENDGKLLFRKLTSTGDVENLKEHVRNSESDITELQDAVRELQPTGTKNQVMLGDGTPTSEETIDGESKFNAASSLFAEPDVRNDALEAVYGEYKDKGSRISIGLFINQIFPVILNKLIESGNVVGGGGGNFITTVTLTITAPANGMPMSNEVGQLEGYEIYEAGTIVWEPDDGVANGTSAYTGSFTLIANIPYQFHPQTSISMNDGELAFERSRTDTFAEEITFEIPATMTPLAQPVLTIPEPEFGGNIPTTATQVDLDSLNYTSSIEWLDNTSLHTISGTFPEGVFTGRFTLTAADRVHRWNSDVVTLNGRVIPSNDVDLSSDGMTLTFEYQTEELLEYLTDTRDGRRYRTVRIGNQVWMAENLNWNGSTNGTTSGPGANTVGVYYNPVPPSLTPGNAEPFAKAGRLYTYAQALTVAPAGWHLPSDAEWDTLVNFIGGATGGGTKLKATAGWNMNGAVSGNGTDNYGFTGLPGGNRGSDSAFRDVGLRGYWWSSTAENATEALYRQLNYDSADVGRRFYNKVDGFSVRCVKN